MAKKMNEIEFKNIVLETIRQGANFSRQEVFAEYCERCCEELDFDVYKRTITKWINEVLNDCCIDNYVAEYDNETYDGEIDLFYKSFEPYEDCVDDAYDVEDDTDDEYDDVEEDEEEDEDESVINDDDTLVTADSRGRIMIPKVLLEEWLGIDAESTVAVKFNDDNIMITYNESDYDVNEEYEVFNREWHNDTCSYGGVRINLKRLFEVTKGDVFTISKKNIKGKHTLVIK